MSPRNVVSCAAAVLVLGACGNLLDPAAAVVHGSKITIDEVQAAVDEFNRSPEYERLAEQGDADAITREFEQSYLSTLIRRAVLTPEATERGIEVTEAEVQDQLDAIAAEFPSQSAFEEALKEQGLTLDQLTQLVEDRALEEKLRAEITAEVGPTDEEIRAFYDDNSDDFRETEAQHILVAKRALATDISRQLQAAPKRQVAGLFARLAKRHSTDNSNKDNAGELGFFSPGDFVPEFDEGAAALAIGEVSDPVRSEFGWHVIRVTGRRPIPFDQASGQIAAQIGGTSEEDAWQAWLHEAYETAEVEVNPRYGEFNLATQAIEDASPRTVPGAEETAPASPEPEHSH
jgi:foldase protein PrsA